MALKSRLSKKTLGEISSKITALQFDRETRLSIGTQVYNEYGAAIVIGVGGTGSWVANFLGRIRNIEHLVLIDPDTVESSNLNRTVFQYDHIGRPKVECVASIISSSSLGTTVYPVQSYFDPNTVNKICELDMLKDFSDKSILVIDCRDNDYRDYDLLETFKTRFSFRKMAVLRCAYNGISITIDFDPVNHPAWGAGGYTETPSHVIPAACAAFLIVSAAFKYYDYKNNKPWIFNNPMTFDVINMLEYLHMGLNILNPGTLPSGESRHRNCISSVIQGKEITVNDQEFLEKIIMEVVERQSPSIREKVTTDIIKRAVEIAMSEIKSEV
jgi:molybdopterin/thiamine biosynthesis adenylyltransferase